MNKLAILSAARLQYCGEVGEVIPGLRKCAFFCVTAATVAIVGCGGSSHSSSGTGGVGTVGTTTQSAAAATVTFPTSYGLVYAGFLTGAGRATGDLYLNIKQVLLNDSYDSLTVYRPQASAPIVLQLNGYSFQMTNFDVPLANINSQLYDSVTIVPYSFAQEQPGGYVGLNPTDPGVLSVLQSNEPAPATPALYSAASIQPNTRLRVFPGRDSTLPIFFDQTMFAIDGSGTNVGLVPDPNQPYSNNGIGATLFQDTNEPTNTIDPSTSGKIPGFISDMVQISLANVPAAHIPTQAQTGLAGAVTDFYLSGDRYALGSSKVASPSNANPNFQELTLDVTAPIVGLVGAPPTVAPGSLITSEFSNPSAAFPGTYDLLQQNPSIFQTAEITSLFGRYRGISSAVAGTSSSPIPLVNLTKTSFDLIVFPNSDESYTYSSPADVIAIVHSGNTIKDLYIGYAWYSGGPSTALTAGARLYPLSSFWNASTAGEVDFAFNRSSFTGTGGLQTTNEPSIRNGSYTITSSTVPTGFPTSKAGSFVVFRQ